MCQNHRQECLCYTTGTGRKFDCSTDIPVCVEFLAGTDLDGLGGGKNKGGNFPPFQLIFNFFHLEELKSLG